MATVPRLVGPQVRSTPEPSRLEPLATYGVDQRGTQAVAAGLENVAGALLRERTRLDEIRANEAEVTFRSMADQAWSDPREGFANRRGTDAAEGLDPFRERVRSAMAQVEGRLATEQQRALFRLRADRVARELDSRAMAHVSGEVEKVDTSSTEALLNAERRRVQEAVALGTTDGSDASVAKSIQRAADMAAQYADRRGLPPAAIAEARFKVVSDMRAAQVATLIDADRAEDAALVLAEFGDQIDPTTRAKLVQANEEAGIRARAQGAEDRLFAAHSESMADALAAARAEFTGDARLRDEVVNRLKTRFAERDAETRQAEQEKVDQAFTALEQSGGNLSAIPPTLWADLAGVRGAREALTQRSQHLREGTEPVQNWQRWQNVLGMSATDLAKMDPMRDLRPHLDDAHFERALSMWREAKGEGAGGAGAGGPAPGGRGVAFSTTMDFDQRTRNAAMLAGVIPAGDASDWSPEQRTAYAIGERAAEAAIADLERAKGGKDNVAPEERQRAIDLAFARQVIVDRGTPGSKEATRRAVQLTRDDTGRARVPHAQIEGPMLVSINRYFERTGYTMTRDKAERIAALQYTMVGATPLEVLEAMELIARDRRGVRPYGSRTESLPSPVDR